MDVDSRSMLGQDELVLVAIRSDNADALRWLVVDLNASGIEVYQEGRNALHEAVVSRSPDVIGWALTSDNKHAGDLWLAEDADGATPLLRAVRQQYVKGVEVMCDSELAGGFFERGSDSCCGAVVGQAFQEAMRAMRAPAAGSAVRRRLRRMLQPMERLLRIMGLSDVHTALLALHHCPCSRPQQWECLLSGIQSEAEAQPWWRRFVAQRRAGTLEQPGPQEGRAEAAAIRSAVSAGQPAVVEWLLDVWGVDFEDVRIMGPEECSLSDCACAAGEEDSQGAILAGEKQDKKAWESWSAILTRWQSERAAGPMSVSDIVKIIKETTLVGYANNIQYGSRWHRDLRQLLRLLDDQDTKGGAVRQTKIIATVELLICRFNMRAVPRLDLLVQASSQTGRNMDTQIRKGERKAGESRGYVENFVHIRQILLY